MWTTTQRGDTASPTLRTRLRVALGTFIALEAQARDAQLAEAALGAAWDAIRAVERLMHPQRKGSDLAGLNQADAGTLVRLHPWTFEVLAICRELNAATHGAFDPCVRESPGRLAALELLAPDTVRVHAPVRVDLGGIAKGFAVDRAVEALRTAGCSGGLVNAGGDLAAFGGRSHTIRCGRVPDVVVFELRDAALASSDTGAAERPPEHRGYYHGTDGAIVVAGRATISAPRAVWADALTKCVLLCQPARRDALLARFGAQLVSFAAA